MIDIEDWLSAPHSTRVRAKRRIHDNPLSRQDDGVPRGAIGVIEDCDQLARMFVVEFDGGRVLLVAPEEVEAA